MKNKTKWKNSFGGKDYQGEKIKKKKGKIKADKISGKNVKKKTAFFQIMKKIAVAIAPLTSAFFIAMEKKILVGGGNNWNGNRKRNKREKFFKRKFGNDQIGKKMGTEKRKNVKKRIFSDYKLKKLLRGRWNYFPPPVLLIYVF